jgi:hypothetical protein
VVGSSRVIVLTISVFYQSYVLRSRCILCFGGWVSSKLESSRKDQPGRTRLRTISSLTRSFVFESLHSQNRDIELWSRNEFNPLNGTDKDWILEHKLKLGPNPTLDDREHHLGVSVPERVSVAMADSLRRKKSVGLTFNTILDKHFRFAAEICGLKYPTKSGSSAVWKSSDMAASIAHDSSHLNVKRLCWTLYFSSGQFYKKAYGCEMSDYLEGAVLKQVEAKYNEAEDAGKKKGCVSLYMNKLINQYRTNVRECLLTNRKSELGSILNSRPENMPKPSKPASRKERETQCLFWVGTKQGNTMTRKKNKGTGTASEKPILSFKEVRNMEWRLFITTSLQILLFYLPCFSKRAGRLFNG